MSVVVTGAAGFIGRHTVAALLGRGLHVVGIDRRPWTPSPGEAAVVGDLASPSPEVLDALRDAAGAIHLAGRPGVRDRDGDVERQRERDNVAAGRTVLETVPAPISLVVVSSSSVYGGAPARHTNHEDDPLLPRGGYARSKLRLELLCQRRAERGGRVSVARPFTVAGEGQRPDMAFARWIAAARQGRPLEVFGRRGRARDVTDVRDVAEGLVRMLEREVGTTVNLGTGVSHGLERLVETVADVLGTPLTVADRSPDPDEVSCTRADTARCRRLLGFAPSTDLRTIVARQAAAAELVGAA